MVVGLSDGFGYNFTARTIGWAFYINFILSFMYKVSNAGKQVLRLISYYQEVNNKAPRNIDITHLKKDATPGIVGGLVKRLRDASYIMKRKKGQSTGLYLTVKGYSLVEKYEKEEVGEEIEVTEVLEEERILKIKKLNTVKLEEVYTRAEALLKIYKWLFIMDKNYKSVKEWREGLVNIIETEIERITI